MAVRFRLPLFTFVNMEQTGLPLMTHNGEKWFPIFTSLENARLYCEREKLSVRILFLESPDAVTELFDSASKDGLLFDDHRFVLDPIWTQSPEFITMSREDFLSAFREAKPPAP